MRGVELHFEGELSRLSEHLRDGLVDGLKVVEPTLREGVKRRKQNYLIPH